MTQMGGEGAFAGFEVFLEQLPPLKTKKPPLHLSPYQPVVRDFAFLVDEVVPADQVVKAATKADRTLITAIHIFDAAIQVRLEPEAGTLTEAQITEVCDKIVSNVIKATNGALRSL
ncbi:MAG: pheT [Alphaproteobacteria bacterium]|nr:pheT [Alphaproteobacteria bacterium]